MTKELKANVISAVAKQVHCHIYALQTMCFVNI